MRNKWVLAISIFLILIFFSLASAQPKEKRDSAVGAIQGSAVRLSKDLPHLYLAFVAIRKTPPRVVGESGERIFLKLVNNSRWKIQVCGGLIALIYGDEELTYEIERVSGTGPVPATPQWNNCQGRMVKSGQSILFSIPRDKVDEGLAVRVPYSYQWERDGDGTANIDEPRHYLYFHYSELPRGIEIRR